MEVGGLGDPRPRNVEKAGWRMLAGECWRAAAEIAQIFACLQSFCLCLLHILPVIHIRHHGSPIIAYGQIAYCQSMKIHQQLMFIQAMTNTSAVACLFCWASVNSSPPSSRDSGRCLYHALILRPGQSHPAIPQAAATTRICPPYSTQTTAETSVEMPTSSSSLTESPCKTPLPRWLCCSS
jgi:hypothetical protein